MSGHILLCDFTFGSYIKLALAQPGRRPEEASLHSCSGREEFNEAVQAFLAERGQPKLVGAAISSRGWESHGVLHLPDEDITIVREEVRDFLKIQRLNLVNNFVARALAIPKLRRAERIKICGGDGMDEQVIAVLGPHHGLGLAALAPDGAGGWSAMSCEGGHSDLPVTNARESDVCRILRAEHGHVAREFAISLSGLVDVWKAIGVLDGGPLRATSAQVIVDAAKAGDARAGEAVRLCLGWLAAMASDIALIQGARGGIYLTGDLMDMLDELFDVEAFQQRYANKGRLSAYVSEIPVYRTQAKDLEIIGLATLFD